MGLNKIGDTKAEDALVVDKEAPEEESIENKAHNDNSKKNPDEVDNMIGNAMSIEKQNPINDIKQKTDVLVNKDDLSDRNEEDGQTENDDNDDDEDDEEEIGFQFKKKKISISNNAILDSDNEDSNIKSDVYKSIIKNKRKTLDSNSENESDTDMLDTVEKATASNSVTNNDSEDDSKNEKVDRKADVEITYIDTKDTPVENDKNMSDQEHVDEDEIDSGKEVHDTKKSRKLKKDELKEMQSEQQRFLRERKCDIPYHKPEVKSVKEFLKRVPSIPNRKARSLPGSSEQINLSDGGGGKSQKKKSLFDLKPVLKQSGDDLEFFDDSIVGAQTESQNKKPITPINNFMKKFSKQIVKKTPVEKTNSSVNNSTELLITGEDVKKETTDKGNVRSQLKMQLKNKIRQSRHQQLVELESQRTKLEEQIALEEEESFDEDDSEASDNESETEKEASEEDEEIEKWNCDEERIRVEELFAEEGKTNGGEPIDENSHSNKMEDENSLGTGKDEEENSTHFNNSLFKENTENGTQAKRKLELPCEDTQDLYKNDSHVSVQDSDNDIELGPNFQLSLDDDTQFTQHLLDSQGFLKANDNKTSKDPPNGKPLFTEELKDLDSMSMTQMLGLCSGKFGESATENSSNNNRSMSFGDTTSDPFGFDNVFSASKKTNSQDQSSALTNFSQALKEVKKEEESKKASSEMNSENKSEEQCLLDSIEIKPSNTEKTDHSNRTDNESDHVDFSISPDKKESDDSEAHESDISDVDNDNKKQNENEDDESQSEDDNNDGNQSEDDNNDGNQSDEQINEESNDEDVPEELQEWNMLLQREKENSKKFKKKAFYEEEAELSGSDVGSDDEELGSDYDEYEIDLEAEKDTHSREQLKRQLHKIHQRKMNDQDKHEMRLLQELYLEDGELGGGEKRKRNFRWRNIDENFKEDSASHEVDEGDNFSDLKERNQELVERNKFLLEQEEVEKCSTELDENSQMILEKIQGSKGLSQSQPVGVIDLSQNTKVPFKRSGSFLRGDLSQVTSSLPNISKSRGKSSGRSFVYQALDENQNVKNKKKKKKMSEDNLSSIPPSKKQKLNTVDQQHRRKTAPSSIFSHL